MKMGRFWRLSGYAVVLSLASCEVPFNMRMVPELHLLSTELISQDRQSWALDMTNPSDHDVFCPRLEVRVVFDNPKDYLETGEENEVVLNEYLVGKQQLHLSGRLPPATAGRNIQVRSISNVEPACFAATIKEFCLYAQKSQTETDDLNRIAKAIHATDCSDILQNAGSFDLTKLPEETLSKRPYTFLR
jgi:hypothetical protein